jgi:flavin-dependent dehydrogenase
MYDVIVVGARCAGSPLAMLLARQGHRVAVLDRRTFPSDTVSSHYLHLHGTARMRDWGLLPRLLATGCPTIERITLRIEDGQRAAHFDEPFPAMSGMTFGVAPRRTVLDTLLRDGAAEAGAEVLEGFTVDELVFDDGRVTGVRGRHRGAAPVTLNARMVVGADGIHSTVADAVHADEYESAPPGTAYWYTYWTGTDFDQFVFTRGPGRELFVAPTHDGAVVVLVGVKNSAFHEFRADIEANYHRVLDAFPLFGDRIRAGERVEPFYGSRFTKQWLRTPYGPGWALLGDAGYHRDPVVGVGMSDAMVHAEKLAEVIDAGLRGTADLDAGLAGFHAWRDRTVRSTYEYAKRIATLDPMPTPMMDVLVALRHDPEQRQRFLRVYGGEVDFREFFAPENSARILQRAQRAQRPAAGVRPAGTTAAAS